MIDDILWFLTRFDWTLIFRMIWRNLRQQGRSLKSATLSNTAMFFMPLSSPWSGVAIEKLLKQYGVKMIGWDITRTQFYFLVSTRQAQWAHTIMARAGVPLEEEK